ncbi:MAG: diguanylate cyclase [Bacilli bacterium]|nr:diguanylate cyclase [Bacilli bacterium]
MAFFELLLFVRESFLVRSLPWRHYLYLISYFVLFAASIASALFIIFNNKRENNEKRIVTVIHSYALIALIWGVTISLLDYIGGNEFPAVFFTILATIGGLLVLNPFIYVPLMILSGVSVILGMYFINPSLLSAGNIINISVLYIMIAVVSYRTTAVAISEADQKHFLTKISQIDALTGLKNENAYYRCLDKFDKDAENYAVIVMDVNGLKHTDDTYGHRYGAYLIQSAGRILPTVFKNCDIFHTGGDEFVCIVTTELPKLDEYLEDFAKTLEYQQITFDGQELFLSLARGVAIHQKGEKYSDVYQRADRDMYVNKPIVKAKYNIQGR